VLGFRASRSRELGVRDSQHRPYRFRWYVQVRGDPVVVDSGGAQAQRLGVGWRKLWVA
jgi:hypothetical protein